MSAGRDLLPIHKSNENLASNACPDNLESAVAKVKQGDSLKKVVSAVFYGSSSILVVFVNKILLTNLRFPSFLFVGIGQMIATILFLFAAKFFGIVKFPDLEYSTLRRIFPLPVLYAMNLVTGLGGTQRTNLPMFTVLRRFSILFTMMLEYFVLRTKSTFAVKVSVFLMIYGSFLAGINDLSFDAYGYILIFVNNIFTAANGVYVKKKLESNDLGKYGLLYYNSLLMFAPTVIATILFTDDLAKVQDFFAINGVNAAIIMCLILSSVCGFILNYSLVLCSSFNTALTTTCVGPIKNLIVTYVGMVSSGDYVFQWANFIGVNISVFGSVIYTYVTFRTSKKSSSQISLKSANRRKITIPLEKHKSDDTKPLL